MVQHENDVSTSRRSQGKSRRSIYTVISNKLLVPSLESGIRGLWRLSNHVEEASSTFTPFPRVVTLGKFERPGRETTPDI